MKYITIAPSKPRARYLVARSGIGHYFVVAETANEDYAAKICDALNRAPVQAQKLEEALAQFPQKKRA